MKVYIAAPYAEAVCVRTTVFSMIRDAGLDPIASWAVEADGEKENLLAIDEERARARWKRNRWELVAADALLVVARDGSGGEMFAETELARAMTLPIFWTGRLTLSAFQPEVRVRAPGHNDGIAIAIRHIADYARRSAANVVPIEPKL